ncbi:hypothetical protein LshimejAT787_1700220 [Lyophyllum shimeji]|uniref:Uncharacterized protein n=1 Tax=Lyophyllum shimeji TaxID=47721 RepID=A0A9P3UU63_LYOSH|nr:hypothetical protein LshimejAT787_1700220 [Lyophyllum shimeji]
MKYSVKGRGQTTEQKATESKFHDHRRGLAVVVANSPGTNAVEIVLRDLRPNQPDPIETLPQSTFEWSGHDPDARGPRWERVVETKDTDLQVEPVHNLKGVA